jgi:hypothetical protein
MQRSKRLLAAIGCFVLLSPSLGAGQKPAAISGATVVVAIHAADAEAEAFRQVLEDAVAYRLKRQGLDPSFLVEEGQESETALVQRATAARAAFSLLCSYAGSRSEMRIAMRWYDVEQKGVAGAVNRKGRVDLTLDTLILEALDDLLGQVQDRIDAVLARQPVRPGKVTEPGPGSGDPGFAVQPPEGAGQPAGVYAQPGARFLLSPGLSPFIAVGAASYYFNIGLQSSVVFDFLIPTRTGRLGLGALLGVNFFIAQGTTERALNFLVPLGVDLRYGLSLGPRLALLFHLSTGPALLAMSTPSEGSLAKVWPFVASGVGLELALGRGLFVALDAGYAVYFETPYLIMGFSPAVSLSWRL